MHKCFSIIVFLLCFVPYSQAKKNIVDEQDSLTIYCNLLEKYFQEKDTINIIYYGIKIKELWNRENIEKNSNYCILIEIISNLFYSTNNITEAKALLEEIIPIKQTLYGRQSSDYANTLNNLANYYSYLGNYSEAIRLGTEAMEIRKEVLGTKHPDYALSLGNLASYYSRLGNYSEAMLFLAQNTDILRNYIINSFSELSSELQESLWNNNYAIIFNTFYPSFVSKTNASDHVSELYDKSALFAKGLLLNTSISMRKLILESGDSAILAKYDAIIANKSIYEKQLEKPIKDRVMNLDSLRYVINSQEMELARESKVYGDFSHNLRINWKDVQQKLGDGDIAIEFMDFPVIGSDSTMYVALTLKKGYSSPHMIPLFELRQLKSVPENIYYTRPKIYDLVWKPLAEELDGVKDIYFAPSGELHRIGIEYVPVTATESICDRYTLHRLSSTRQLAFIQDDTKGKNAVLYGGLIYDSKTNPESRVGGSCDNDSQDKRDFRVIQYANVDSLGLRGSFEYLPGTKDEADKIAHDLKGHSMPYLYFYGSKGTEESFKSLDGTKPKIMHIATHGFYLTQQDADRSSFARPLQLEDRRTYHEDKPMTRSGILLSSCSPALDHEKIPEGAEDGILTAQEISKIDLMGLDLVVLSACQTGLGDIISGEGVFGLQRGFKNAGAKTIVMSLWKVDDNATRQLMTSFYNHYLEGMPKEQAFRTAQSELRKQSTVRQKKPDWAAFIMMDGI